jgi:hypothetical protein
VPETPNIVGLLALVRTKWRHRVAPLHPKVAQPWRWSGVVPLQLASSRRLPLHRWAVIGTRRVDRFAVNRAAISAGASRGRSSGLPVAGDVAVVDQPGEHRFLLNAGKAAQRALRWRTGGLALQGRR